MPLAIIWVVSEKSFCQGDAVGTEKIGVFSTFVPIAFLFFVELICYD